MSAAGLNTVWLASYPKSGNTWVRTLFLAWRRDAPVDINELDDAPIAASRRAFDRALGICTSQLTPREIDRLRPTADAVVGAGSPDEVLLRKVHDGLYRDDEGRTVVSENVRGAVYVVRDPRDVAISFAHHLGRPLDSVVSGMADQDCALATTAAAMQLPQRLGSWSAHVDSWTVAPPFQLHTVRYEDLLAAPEESLAKILAAFGLPVEQDRIRRAVERVSFESLRAQEQLAGFRERMSPSAPFFRGGVAGGWRTELDPELVEQIVADHGEVMARFGYC
jgi:aryl sulfotransferase